MKELLASFYPRRIAADPIMNEDLMPINAKTPSSTPPKTVRGAQVAPTVPPH